MPTIKQTSLSAVAITALLALPNAPAAAAVPLLFAPWAIGHLVGVGVRLATLPLVAASVIQPPAPYPAGQSYYGAANYYSPAAGYYPSANYYAPPANYYAPRPAYYGQSPAYYSAPQAYYRPALAYAPPMPRYYMPTRGYYPARASYSAGYRSPAYPRPGGFTYRRR